MLNGQIGVVIADDHPVVRLGLRYFLESEPAFAFLGEAEDGKAALELTRRLRPDVLLLDLAMPGIPGLEVLRQMIRADIGTRVIVMTAAADKQQLVRALELGARGVVLKDSGAPEMAEAIRAVTGGRYWVGQQKIGDLVSVLQQVLSSKASQRNTFGLTSREMQVVSALVEGCTNKDIAQTLSISEDTVKRHLTNIFNKLGVYNRLELGMFAVNHHLLDHSCA